MQVDKKTLLCALSILICSLTGRLPAAVTGTSGDVTETAPPASVLLNDFESNQIIALFAEGSLIELPGDILANITEPGFYDSLTDQTPGTIPAGTVVNSYLLHTDPSLPIVGYSGSVTFDSEVLGIYINHIGLRLTDAVLGAPGTAYPPPPGLLSRGLELGSGGDFISFSADRRTVSVSLTTGLFQDQVRIVTLAPLSADLAVSKSGPAAVVAGTSLVYTIQVTNSGPTLAQNVEVADTTPAGLAFVSNQGACQTPFPCNLGTLAGGQTRTITTTLSVPADYDGPDVIENTASASSTTSDPSPGNGSSTAQTTVLKQADLSIVKTGPSEASRGTTLSYAIEVTNNGPSIAQGVTISDSTPAGLVLLFTSGGCSTAFPCSLGTMEVGETRTILANYLLPINYNGPRIILNTAAGASSTSEGQAGDESSSAETIVVPSADLSISQTFSPSQATVGEALTFHLMVENLGLDDALDVVVSLILPEQFSFLSASPPCHFSGASVRCEIGPLTSGGRRTFTAEVMPESPGLFGFLALVGSPTPDPNFGNNDANSQIQVLFDDGDGVPPEVEDAAPNQGDGNQDEVLDSLQRHVSSLPNAGNGQYVTLAAPDGTQFRNVQAVGNPSPENSPENVEFPLGFFQYAVEQIPAGGAFSVTYLLFSDELPLTTFFKFGPTPDNPQPHWYEFLFDGSTGAELLGDRIVVHFVDGERGDDDLSANARISQVGGPAFERGGGTLEEEFRYVPQMANGTGDGIQFRTTFIFASTGGPSAVTIEFFTPQGTPAAVALTGLAAAVSHTVDLLRGEAVSLETPGDGPLFVGYARLRLPATVGAIAVLTRSEPQSGIVLTETAVSAVSPAEPFSIALDSLGLHDTGLAVVNPLPEEGEEPSSADLVLRLYDQDSNLLATRFLTLASGEQTARFVWEFFADTDPPVAEQAQELRGALTIASSRPLAAVTLRQNDNPLLQFPDVVPNLTTFPVAPGRFEQPQGDAQPTVFYFPQINNGASSASTTLALINTGADTTVILEFFDNSGQPMPLELSGLGSGTFFEIALQAGQSFFTSTSGEGDLQVGYARVTANSDVQGTAIFSRTDTATGTLLFETGIPSTRPQEDFTVVLDSLGAKDTGLAMLNPLQGPDAPTANVVLRLYDDKFQLLGTAELTLAPGRQLSQFVFEIFSDLLPAVSEQAQELLGVLTVESDLGLAVVTLRQNDDPALQFPDEVPTLTTFPVIPGRADGN